MKFIVQPETDSDNSAKSPPTIEFEERPAGKNQVGMRVTLRDPNRVLYIPSEEWKAFLRAVK